MADAHVKDNVSPKRHKDLKPNPGIGQSKGAFACGSDLGDAEGDVENDPALQGEVNPSRVGRTNK